MNDDKRRRPAAFAMPSERAQTESRTESASSAKPDETSGEERKVRTKARKPRAAMPSARVIETPPEDDPFNTQAVQAADVPLQAGRKRGFGFGKLLLTALGILFSLGIGLWVDSIVRDLFARTDWLGWLALGAAGLAAVALLGLVLRELLALRRLSSIAKYQARAADALARRDSKPARELIADLESFLADHPETRAGRAELRKLKNDIIDGPDLLAIAERAMLAPLDARAQRIVLDAAKRVSVVTAVSPRALVDVGYVLFEAGRMIRAIAELYGGRPGTLGFVRLARSVIAHLAVTGTIAVGDSLASQVLGHGLAARLSARLGEGVVNGLMTVRIGIAAMETARPLPFTALKRPAMSDFMTAIVSFSGTKRDQNATPDEPVS